jgi:rSAM/selenodomain-associated transferase 1
MEEALIIFTRNPTLGSVKSRLAVAVGAEEALRIFLYLLDITRRMTDLVPVHRFLYYSDEVDCCDAWDNDLYTKRLQCGNDLGRRMCHAFEEVMSEGYKRVVIIGTDCPYLDRANLMNAYHLLNTTDFVVGPAEDGGYYCLGMRFLLPEVFDGIEWGTSSVMKQTCEVIVQRGYRLDHLPRLADIDTVVDWNRYLEELQGRGLSPFL